MSDDINVVVSGTTVTVVEIENDPQVTVAQVESNSVVTTVEVQGQEPIVVVQLTVLPEIALAQFIERGPTGPTHDPVTIVGPGNGLTLNAGQGLSLGLSSASANGALSSDDWNTFNNKLDPSRGNYVTNADFELDTSDWNFYNDQGRTDPAVVVIDDLTYTAVASGNAGNGINIDYIFHASQSYLTPLVTVLTPTHITVAWYNGPAVTNNPTATQLKAAWDAVPGAVALATVVISGSATTRQYISGSHLTTGGGDTSPVDGTGGVASGLTLTQNTSTPLVGNASGQFSKDAANREGMGLSTDFVIDTLDKGAELQLSFAYSGSAAMVLGTSSDVKMFIYDVTNAALLPITPLATIAGPVNTAKTFVGKFTTSATSSTYRLILHIATSSALAWDLLIDNFVISSILNAELATKVQSLVLENQPISGAVTDHMVVMWRDGATQWVPATIAGACLPVFGSDITQLGFATSIVGSTADIFIRGILDGFSFGPFTGYHQYLDNTAGAISPLPSPFTDRYLRVGKAISTTSLYIQFDIHLSLIANASGTPLKGGLLSNSAVNDGTGDQVLAVGANGNVLVANSPSTLGLQWAAAVVAAAPFTYTLATRTLTIATATGSVAGVLSAADWTTFNSKLTSALSSAQLLVGSSGNVATARAITGDISISNTGVVSITANSVTNAALAQMPANRIKGNNTAGTANALDLTVAQVQTMLGTSGTNTGDVTLGAFGSTPNANGASLTAQALTLQPASATQPGGVTTGVQSFAGAKTFTGAIAASNFSGTHAGTSSGTNSGDQTITLTGDVTGSGTGSFAATIAANAVTNAKAAQMAAHTMKGNNTGSTANAIDLTLAQVESEITSGIVNSSAVTGATVTQALNTLAESFTEVYLQAIKNAGSVTANTTIPTWTTVTKDTNSAFNATTGVYTVLVAGDYEVTFNAATTSGTPLAKIYYNGNLVQTGVGSGVRTSATFFISNAAVNDTITVALDTSLTLTSTATDTTLNICKVVGSGIGPVNMRYFSATGTITSSLSLITYSTSSFNTNAGSYATGVYTIPTNGKYNVKASLALTAATAAAGNNYDIIIRKNGIEVARNKFVVGAATQKPNLVVVDDLIACVAGDTIDIQASAAGTTPSISASTTLNYLYINRVSI